MPQTRLKTKIFVFVASCVLTLAVCFFVYDTLFAGKIIFGPKDFTASLAPLQEQELQELPDEPEELPEQPEEEKEEEPKEADPLSVAPAQISNQELLDDIAEKLDLIAWEIEQIKQSREDGTVFEEDGLEEELNNKPKIKLASASSASKPFYLQILISEIQLSPKQARFIELYNPNQQAISLSGWYLQRKTATSDSWNSWVSSVKLQGLAIGPKEYFTIAGSGPADLVIENLTLTEGNSFALKNPNREISDQLNLVFYPQIKEGQSLARIWQESSQSYIGFGISKPTPGSRNAKLFDLPKQEVSIQGEESGVLTATVLAN